MTDKTITQVEAIKRFNQSLIRHTAQPDCRTCASYAHGLFASDNCMIEREDGVCTNGDKYEAAPRVVLWRTE